MTSSRTATAVVPAAVHLREAFQPEAAQRNHSHASRHWTLSSVAAIVLASFAFLIPAFLNGFPFLYPDSGDYLVLTPQLYRSPFYSLFLLFAHMNRFIWNAVLVQALVLSWLLFILCRLYSSRPVTTFLILVALLVPFSSAAYFASFIMADIMTPLMFLALYILAFHLSELSRFDSISVFLFACLATCSHIAHITMGVGLLALIAVLLALTGNSWRTVVRRVGLLSLPIVLSAAALLLNNAVIHRAFTLYPAGNSLLMASLIEAGPGRRYLHDACPEAGYKICRIADRLPRTANQLLWGGPYTALGGLRAMEDEARTIVQATLRAYPEEVAAMVIHNFVAALHTHRPAYEFIPWTGEVPSMTALIDKKFGQRGARCLSRQRAIEGQGSARLDRRGGRHRVPVIASRLRLVLGARRCDARWWSRPVLRLSSSAAFSETHCLHPRLPAFSTGTRRGSPGSSSPPACSFGRG